MNEASFNSPDDPLDPQRDEAGEQYETYEHAEDAGDWQEEPDEGDSAPSAGSYSGTPTGCLGERAGGHEEPTEWPDDPDIEELPAAETAQDALNSPDKSVTDASDAEPLGAEESPNDRSEPTFWIEAPPQSTYLQETQQVWEAQEREHPWFGIPSERGFHFMARVAGWSVDAEQSGLTPELQETVAAEFAAMREAYPEAPVIDRLSGLWATELLKDGTVPEELVFETVVETCSPAGTPRAVVDAAMDARPESAEQVLDHFVTYTREQQGDEAGAAMQEAVGAAQEARNDQLVRDMLHPPHAIITTEELWGTLRADTIAMRTETDDDVVWLHDDEQWGDTPLDVRTSIAQTYADLPPLHRKDPEYRAYITREVKDIIEGLDAVQAEHPSAAPALDRIRFDRAAELYYFGHPDDAVAMGRAMHSGETQADLTRAILEHGKQGDIERALEVTTANRDPAIMARQLFWEDWSKVLPLEDMYLAPDSLNFEHESEHPGMRTMQQIITDEAADPARRLACMKHLLDATIEVASYLHNNPEKGTQWNALINQADRYMNEISNLENRPPPA